MSRTPAYYPLHSITTGQYTSGGEYVYWKPVTLDTDIEYVGLYHVLPNGEVWTGAVPSDTSQRLVEKRFEVSYDVKVYDRNRDRTINRYVSPVSVWPRPTQEDYMTGYIDRFFVQKRNQPYNTIQEIDADQYISINTTDKPGINGLIWNHVQLRWYITGKFASDMNQTAIHKAEKNFPGLKMYLKFPLEFWK